MLDHCDISIHSCTQLIRFAFTCYTMNKNTHCFLCECETHERVGRNLRLILAWRIVISEYTASLDPVL